jgi:hypothetical protein
MAAGRTKGGPLPGAVAAAELWVRICNMALRVALAAPAREETFIGHFLLKTPFGNYA